MRILLIRVNDRSGRGFSYETNLTGIYPPLGLAYIASVLRKIGYTVLILDLQILNLNPFTLKERIKEIGPDIILFTATTLIWPNVIETANLIRGAFANILIGAGGPHLSVYPVESLHNDVIDFGIYGEGETVISEVIKNIMSKKGLDNVKGCIFKREGRIIVNQSKGEIEDLDEIPFPAIDLLPYRRYFALSVKHPFFTMVTSRGCPYRCRFCFQGYLGKYRFRSPEDVAEEIDMYVNKYGVKEIVVFDETFVIEKERVLKICELIDKRRLRFNWDIRTRVDLLNKEILVALKRAGCYRLHLGIESGNQGILNEMNKRISIAGIIEKVNLAKKFGFELRGYFMLAYPGETYRNILKTIEFAKSLPLEWASFTITIGLPETDIYKEALREGYFQTDYWREYTKGNILNSKPYFIPEGLQESDLFALKRKAYLEFYFRPKIICNILTNLKSLNLVKNFRIFWRFSPSIFRSITRV